jgi:hypothetical protein
MPCRKGVRFQQNNNKLYDYEMLQIIFPFSACIFSLQLPELVAVQFVLDQNIKPKRLAEFSMAGIYANTFSVSRESSAFQ